MNPILKIRFFRNMHSMAFQTPLQASRVVGGGFESLPRHTKDVKNITSSSLAEARIKRVVTGK